MDYIQMKKMMQKGVKKDSGNVKVEGASLINRLTI